jgi:hypothetical protein
MLKRSLLLALAVTLVTSGAATAANWYGDVSTDFFTAANWSDYAAPNGDLYVRYLPIGTVSNECTLTSSYNGGTLYVVNGGTFNSKAPSYFSGGIACYQASQIYVTSGTMNIYQATISTQNSVRAAGNFYLGYGTAANGVLNVEPNARITIKSVLTIAGNSSTAQGTLNLWGHLDCAGLRLNYNGGTYHINLYDGADFWQGGSDNTATLNAGVVSGSIASMVSGKTPYATYDSVNNGTWLRLVRQYAASIPSPANNATIQNMTAASQAQTLSWVKPVPEDPTKPVTSDVYFGTDPNNMAQVAAGMSGNSVDVTIDKLQTYYWRVDSYDPNLLAAYQADSNNRNPLTTGDRWTFNTNNTAPVVGVTAPHMTNNQVPNVVLWLPDNTSATMTATVTDDGYPLAGPVTYQWERQNQQVTAPIDPNWYTISTSSTATTPVYSSVAGASYDNFNYRLTVTDGTGGLSTVHTFLVRVFKDTCEAAPNVTGFVRPTGELSGDCRVNFMDLSVFAANWLSCNAAGSVCN